MKPAKCMAPGCKEKHKSLTGYCAKHADKITRHRTYVREGRTCPEPHLVEEGYNEGYDYTRRREDEGFV